MMGILQVRDTSDHPEKRHEGRPIVLPLVFGVSFLGPVSRRNALVRVTDLPISRLLAQLLFPPRMSDVMI